MSQGAYWRVSRLDCHSFANASPILDCLVDEDTHDGLQPSIAFRLFKGKLGKDSMFLAEIKPTTGIWWLRLGLEVGFYSCDRE